MRKIFKIFTFTIFSLVVAWSSPSKASPVYVDVNGLVCDFCARALEKVFGRQEAVLDIDVNLDSKIITINFKEGQDLDDEIIQELITDSGYNVEDIRRGDDSKRDETAVSPDQSDG